MVQSCRGEDMTQSDLAAPGASLGSDLTEPPQVLKHDTRFGVLVG